MTEGNFVDYVKIFVSSGKGGKGSTHLHREFIEKVDRMVVMEVVVDMFFL
jgi:GTPase involved in cell partitioning and DNA repair